MEEMLPDIALASAAGHYCNGANSNCMDWVDLTVSLQLASSVAYGRVDVKCRYGQEACLPCRAGVHN